MTGGSLYRIAAIGEICVDVRTNYLCPLHTHDTYSVGRFRGSARIWCRGRAWDVDAGCIVLLEPGEAHRGTPLSRGCGQDGILPDPALMTKLFGGPRMLRVPRPIVADAVLAESLSRAAAARDAAGLRHLLARLFARYAEPALARPEPAPGRPLVPDIGRSVAAASRAQGVSRSHFSRTLRAQTGLTPRDLRRQLRVARARALIEGGHDLASAALASGFADQAHMTRQLRSLLGVTPAALRRREI
jgi:AraC-like DNA-binding protein